jgi:ribonuclease P protein subunit POP4
LSENLFSADLHGASLIGDPYVDMSLRYRVVECKAASYKGVNDIMIRNTAETFGIIFEDDRLSRFV